MADFGIGEGIALAGMMGSGLSLASMGMKAGGDVASGLAKQQEAGVKAQDYLLQAKSQATNYELQGASTAANARMKATADATNYQYQGEQQKAQFGITSSQDLMQASQADTAAEFGDLQASMTDAAARRQITQTLGNITVMRQAGGADFTSPTTAALEGNVAGVSEMNRQASVASINAQTATERASAEYLRGASAFALTQGQNAENMGNWNAATALKFGDYNAKTAETYAAYNAKTALEYGSYNANAATSMGSTAAGMGYFSAGADIFGGLGKALGSGGIGSSSSSGN